MDQEKFDALVHYICARCEDPTSLGATKLNKIMWYSDASAYLYLGRSITGATYIKRQFGPVPRDIKEARMRLIAAGAIVEREAPYYGYAQTRFIALRRPDLSSFSADEISLVDQMIEAICKNHTASSISAHSHDLIWKSAEIGEEIPLLAMLGSYPGEITEDHIAWGKAEMLKLEPHRSAA
jgi:hypothetical protein